MKQKTSNPHYTSFGKLAVVTITAVYLLILVGGIVRSSGSGMGCPDWPKCFGNYIPPTDASQLPDDYQQVYLQKRLDKNERLAVLLDRIGMQQTAHALRTEEAIKEESDFNVVTTWIEYLNRLVGVVIGLLILATFIRSLYLWKERKSIALLSGFALLLVIFQGWLGALVVSTNLLPWMVTIHMLPALLLVAVLMQARYKAVAPVLEGFGSRQLASLTLWVALLLTLIQIVIGTQVREHIDAIAMAFGYEQRENWVAQLDVAFYIHRSFSWLLLGAHLFLVFICHREKNRELSRWAVVLLAVVCTEGLVGVGLAYAGFPAFLQPIHLVLGTLLFGLQYYMVLLVSNSTLQKTDYKLQTC
jgi:heme a synthase